MKTKFYQACFTRVDTGNLSAGWQMVNTSADIVQSMVSFFETNEKSNDVSVNKKNADGSPLKVTKIICDGKHIGLAQVQYGLSDERGREHFFSHGYVAGEAYEVLKHPEQVLTISDDNFRFSVEETQDAPAELSFSSPPTEQAIMEKYGLDREACVKFVKCALFPLLASTQTTLFVKTDGSREMAMDLLYLIYRALPYSLRTRVTASTYAKPTGVNSMYVFTDDIPGVGNHVDPITGENNILGDAYEKRLARFPFILCYAECLPQPDEDHDAYYTAVETVLRDMGDIRLNKMESLRLAFMTLADAGVKKDEISGLLYDWLSLPVSANENVLARIEKFVCAATEKGADLSENVIKLLRERINESRSQALYDAYVQYEAHSMIKMGSAAFVKFDAYKRDKEFWQCASQEMRESADGEALLNAYYLTRAKELVASRTCAYSDMTNFVKDCLYVPDIQTIRDIFCQKCREIVLSEQQKGKNYKPIYESYLAAVGEIDPQAEIDWTAITTDYDIAFRSSFDETRISEYQSFYGRFKDDYPWSYDFLQIWAAVDQKKFNEAIAYVENGCCIGNYEFDPESDDIKCFTQRIFDRALANDAAELCKNMKFWVTFAKKLNVDLVELMARKHVYVLCRPEELDMAMKMDSFWWHLGNLELIYEGCRRYCEKNKEQQSITKYTLRLLKDQIAEVKKAQKADAKKQKQEDTPNASNPLKSVFQSLRNVGKRSGGEEAEDSFFAEEPGKAPRRGQQENPREQQANRNNRKHK